MMLSSKKEIAKHSDTMCASVSAESADSACSRDEAVPCCSPIGGLREFPRGGCAVSCGNQWLKSAESARSREVADPLYSVIEGNNPQRQPRRQKTLAAVSSPWW